MSAARKRNVANRNLVVGLGATGLSVARYLRRAGEDAAFADSRQEPPGIAALKAVWPDAAVSLGQMVIPDDTARIVVSPGVPDSTPLLMGARQQGIPVISDIELFALEASAPYAAITGSNGKSTVTTLLYHMARAAGKDALAGGNLGEPALDLLAAPTPDIYVLELSSFQLQRTHSLAPEVAVLLNVSPDHLDWHRSVSEYCDAKYSIFRDARAAVVNRADPRASEEVRGVDRVISFGMDEPAEGHYGVRSEGGADYLARGETMLIAVADMALFGRHNHANALAALAAGELLGFETGAMLQVLHEFPGLPHRMQHVARKASVDYVNDSKATNVAAAVASIESIDGRIVLLAGGEGKGADFAELGRALETRLRAAILFGTDAPRIAEALDTVMPVYFAVDMNDAVQQAADFAEADDTVLLAPACASFDQYANYAARGDAFCAAVRALGR